MYIEDELWQELDACAKGRPPFKEVSRKKNDIVSEALKAYLPTQKERRP